MELVTTFLIFFWSLAGCSQAQTNNVGIKQSEQQQHLRGRELTYDCVSGCGLDEVGHGPPVCGTDGFTYFNECLAICQGTEVERPGACPGDRPIDPDDSTYIREGRVTMAEMQAFKAEKFKFVAKRKLSDKVPDHEPKDNRGPESGNGGGKGNGNSDGNGSRKGKREQALRITPTGAQYAADLDDIPAGFVPETPGTGDITAPPTLGGGRLLSILGSDTRVQTSGYTWPNWRLGQVLYGSWGGCSGAIVGKDAVLTAGHCVHDKDEGGWMKPTRFAPGRYRSGSSLSDPWGSWNVLYSTTYTKWTQDKDGEYDIAVMKIGTDHDSWSDRSIGDHMGTLGMTLMACGANGYLPGEADLRITGYPGDKSSGSLWSTGQCEDWWHACNARKVYHKCDTAGGMSGSAIRDDSNKIVGVHAYGNGGSSWNSGTALTESHVYSINSWL